MAYQARNSDNSPRTPGTYQARNSDNSARTPSAFERHNNANADVAGGLKGQNAYDRHTFEDLHDENNPSAVLKTDVYGNQYYDWNDDYVHHKFDNSTDTVPLGKSTKPHVEGTLRVGSVITVFKGSFTGGVPPVTLATKLQARTAGSSDAYADLTSATSATTHTYTLTASEVGKELRATTTATDDDSNTLTNDGIPTTGVVAAVSVSTATSFTGLVKIGETLTITAATGAGGIAPLQYMVQVRLSTTGSGDWVNTNLGNTNTAGSTFTYEIPSDAAGKYIQIRTRIRDNDGTGDSAQIFSNAGSAQVIADNVTITNDISYTGFLKIGKDLAVVGATATGGISPLQYLNQVTFDSGPPDFDVNTLNMGGTHNTAAFEQTYTIPNSAAGKFITFRTQVRDNDGGSGYEEVFSNTVSAQVADDLATTGDNGTISGSFIVGQTITGLALATFTGGLAPLSYEAKFQVSADGSSGWSDLDGDFTSVATAADISYTLTASEETKYIRLQTRVTDATGDTLVRGGTSYGAVAAA